MSSELRHCVFLSLFNGETSTGRSLCCIFAFSTAQSFRAKGVHMEVLSSTETLGRRSWGWDLGVWFVNHVCSSAHVRAPQHYGWPHCHLEGVSGLRWARSETEVNLRQAIPDTTACNHACVAQCCITLHDFHVMLWPLAALLQAAGLSQASTLSRKRT